MQATARMASVVSSTLPARRRLIRDVRPFRTHTMTDNHRPTAFVAMQFESDHWRDKRYVAIREELEHAGFSCVRADELKTSGPVVDAPIQCRLTSVKSSSHTHSGTPVVLLTMRLQRTAPRWKAGGFERTP